MKSAFIRALWGEANSEERYFKRRPKMNNDIKLIRYNKFSKPFTTFVFGDDNYKYLTDLGFDCRLVDKKPVLWPTDGTYHQYGHKLKVLESAMEEFEEVVFLDWDCMAAKQLPKNFWKVLRQKEPLQASMRGYKKARCLWRKTDRRKRPCASFIYLSDKAIAKEMMDRWLARPRLSEEHILAMITDDMMGSWQGKEKYWDMFEPDFFILAKNEVPFHIYDIDLLKTKDRTFLHVNRQTAAPILKIANRLGSDDLRKEFVSEVLTQKLDNFIFQRGDGIISLPDIERQIVKGGSR